MHAMTRVSHQHRSHGYHNPFRRATVDNSCPVCNKTFGNRAKALEHGAYRAKTCRPSWTVAFLGLLRKRRLAPMNLRERRPPNLAAQGG